MKTVPTGSPRPNITSHTAATARAQAAKNASTLAALKPRSFSGLGLWLLYGAYLVLLFLVAYQNGAGPEYRTWTTVNLYLPQIIWGIPAPFFAVAAFFMLHKPRRRKRAAGISAVLLLPLLYVGGPLMGLHGAGRFWEQAEPPPPPPAAKNALRVMTYNIAGHGSEATSAGLAAEIARQQPDLLLLQEAGNTDIGAMLQTVHPDWHIKADGEFVVATPLPLLSFEKHLLAQLADDPWKAPAYVRCVVQIGTVRAVVYNVHLSTPRPGLEALRHRERGAAQLLQSNTTTRLFQALQVAQAAVRETIPTIVAGDFNAPDPSLVCQQIQRAGFRDAFSVAGQGYGYTTGHEFRLHQSFARVDHIYAAPSWRVHDCYAGNKEASDHRPVVAVLSLAAAPDAVP